MLLVVPNIVPVAGHSLSHFLLQVENELKSICNDILDVLDKHLIPAANTGESKVFYYKMYEPLLLLSMCLFGDRWLLLFF